MVRHQSWPRALAVPLVLAAFLAVPASAPTQPRAGNGVAIDQCANGDNGLDDCTGGAWTTGNLNRNNSAYREGDFVPIRAVATSLASGVTYTLQIGYDAVEDGLHAYDYLGTFNASAAPGRQVVPCYGVAGTGGSHACGSGPSTLAVPPDTHTTFPRGGQIPGVFSAWGATLTGAAYVNPTPITVGTTGTVQRLINVTFTAAGDTAVLAWGGHIASNLDWGDGNTFVGSHSGASFHMRVLSLNGASTGHQDLSLHGDAIAPLPAPFVTQVDRSRAEVGSAVVDEATLGGRPGAPLSGDVSFFVCGPAAAPPDCTTGGTAIPVAVVVAARTLIGPDGVASAQFVPTAAGFYCFRAEFVPSASALYSSAAHTDTTAECFEAVVTPPRLTLTKICVPPLAGTWNISLNADLVLPNVQCGATTTVTRDPGTYTVTETRGSTGGGNFSAEFGGNCVQTGFGTPAWTASITLANGDSKKCTITNLQTGGPTPPVTGTLTVNKVCSPATDPGRFGVQVDGPNSVALRFTDLPCGGTTGPVALAPGVYTVGETNGTDTSLADYTTAIDGACAGGSVTVVANAAATCTITNTRIPAPPATITVTKLCVPGTGGRFTITINGNDEGTLSCGDSTRAVPANPGLHVLGETGAGGTDVSDYIVVWGGACQSDGTVLVGVSEQATCTLTNERRSQPPASALLTVQKLCVPSDDGGQFILRINNQVSADQPCGGRLGPLVVSPGVNHVGEAAGTKTSLGDYITVIGGACAADGSVTLTPGQSATCTITNVRNREDSAGGGGGTPPAADTAQITLVKHCRPARVKTRFQLSVDGNVFPGMRCGQSTGPVVISTGAHSVGEAAINAQPGLFRTTIGGDCSARGAITLAPGQHATCIVTNVRRPLHSLRPPAACYRLTLARRMVGVGNRIRVLAHVRLHRRPIQGVRVYAVGPGVFAVRTTNRRGAALFLLRLRRAGILTLRIRKPFACPPRDPKQVGILGASQPSLTG
jgi:hypothetical protein